MHISVRYKVQLYTDDTNDNDANDDDNDTRRTNHDCIGSLAHEPKMTWVRGSRGSISTLPWIELRPSPWEARTVILCFHSSESDIAPVSANAPLGLVHTKRK